MTYLLTMIARGEVFIHHPGILFFDIHPQCKIGELIEFKLFDEVIAHGKVIGIENPKSCIIPVDDSGKSGKWKIHWFPIGPEEVFKIQNDHPSLKCPKGCKERSQVYNSGGNASNPGARYRRCPKCKTRWLTREIFVQRIESNVRKSVPK